MNKLITINIFFSFFIFVYNELATVKGVHMKITEAEIQEKVLKIEKEHLQSNKDKIVKRELQLELQLECKELVEKANKLHTFKGTKEFYELPRKHKDLLYKQSRLMDEYIQVLGKRMELLKITDFHDFKESVK